MVAVRRDFAKLFSVKREINVKFSVNRDFPYVFVINLLYADKDLNNLETIVNEELLRLCEWLDR